MFKNFTKKILKIATVTTFAIPAGAYYYDKIKESNLKDTRYFYYPCARDEPWKIKNDALYCYRNRCKGLRVGKYTSQI